MPRAPSIAVAWSAFVLMSAFCSAFGAQESPPCSGTVWHGRPDTLTARSLAKLALRMAWLADSSRLVLMAASPTGEYEDATPDFYTGPAEIARRAAAYGPDDPTTLLIASRLALRAATLGEGEIDTTLGKSAQCYAKRALASSARTHDAIRADSARVLIREIGVDLDQQRRLDSTKQARKNAHPPR